MYDKFQGWNHLIAMIINLGKYSYLLSYLLHKQIYDMVNDGGVTINFASFYFANYPLLTLQLKILKVCLSPCVISVDLIGSFAINRSGIAMTTTAKDNYSSMGNPSVSMAALSC